jgi:phosphoglycolate phosphatase-like HAD superfamily hydrolase
MKKDKAVLVDIDGTLFKEVPGWTQENDLWWVEETLKMDELIVGIELIKLFKENGFKLVFLTARGQTCKKNTWIRFKKAGIDHLVDSMWHRPTSWNGVPPVEYKKFMMKRIMNKYNVMFALDDSDKNLAMFEELGIKTIDAKNWWQD